jgi:hypothetical protein
MQPPRQATLTRASTHGSMPGSPVLVPTDASSAPLGAIAALKAQIAGLGEVGELLRRHEMAKILAGRHRNVDIHSYRLLPPLPMC